ATATASWAVAAMYEYIFVLLMPLTLYMLLIMFGCLELLCSTAHLLLILILLLYSMADRILPILLGVVCWVSLDYPDAS
ncbi:MAG: hypothetical protein QXF26_09545, partial [Candidatus Bathyarchaeia archaeon]